MGRSKTGPWLNDAHGLVEWVDDPNDTLGVSRVNAEKVSRAYPGCVLVPEREAIYRHRGIIK